MCLIALLLRLWWKGGGECVDSHCKRRVFPHRIHVCTYKEGQTPHERQYHQVRDTKTKINMTDRSPTPCSVRRVRTEHWCSRLCRSCLALTSETAGVVVMWLYAQAAIQCVKGAWISKRMHNFVATSTTLYL